MTPQKIKDKVLAAWLAQMDKYAEGPVIGGYYCKQKSCFLCESLLEPEKEEECCECPLFLWGNPNQDDFRCSDHKTFSDLANEVKINRDDYFELSEITPSLTAAMSLRHEFYVRGYEVLKDADPERFVSSEGFPELLEIDRELAGGG